MNSESSASVYLATCWGAYCPVVCEMVTSLTSYSIHSFAIDLSQVGGLFFFFFLFFSDARSILMSNTSHSTVLLFFVFNLIILSAFHSQILELSNLDRNKAEVGIFEPVMMAS